MADAHTLDRAGLPRDSNDADDQVALLPTSALSVVAIAGLLVMFGYRTTRPIVDLDMWHMMSLARELFTLGYVPWADDAAFTPTLYPVVHHEWGAGIVAYGVASWFGAVGVAMLRNCLTFGLAVCVWRTARFRNASFVVLTFLMPIAILLVDYGFSPIRAQMYSFVFVAIMLDWLSRGTFQRGMVWTVLWLVLFTVWLNIHAGFLVGAGLFAVYWFEQWLRRKPHGHLLRTGLAMIPLTAVNPFGVYFHRYVWNAIRLDRIHVAEWEPVWAMDGSHLGCLGLSILLLVYALMNIRLKGAVGISVVLATLAASVMSRRMVPFYAIAWAVFVPAWLDGSQLAHSLRRLFRDLRTPMMIIWSLILLVIGSLWISSQPWRVVVPGLPLANDRSIVYPVSAVDYLQDAGVDTNLMVPFDVGAYVSWKLKPLVKVSIDSRYEAAYPPQFADDNYQLYMTQDDWRPLLARNGTNAVLIPSWLPLSQEMPGVAGWHRVYSDASYSIFAINGSPLPIQQEQAETKAFGTIP